MPNTPKPKRRVRKAQERMAALAQNNPVLVAQRRIPADTRNIPQFPRTTSTASTQRGSNTNTGLAFTGRGYPAGFADNPAKAQADVNRRAAQRQQRIAASQSAILGRSNMGTNTTTTTGRKKKRTR